MSLHEVSYIRHKNLFGKLSNTESSGINELDLYIIILCISDVLKGTGVLEGTINGDRGRVDRPCSSFPLVFTAILLRKETGHTDFALNIFLSIRPVPIS